MKRGQRCPEGPAPQVTVRVPRRHAATAQIG